jgi:hypothetical protein
VGWDASLSVFGSRACLASIVTLGAALRLWQYGTNASLRADEGNMALNLVSRSLAGVLAPLDYGQVAPVGWLAVEKVAITAFGQGELVLRLLPLLASLAALPLFWAVARQTLTGVAVPVAVTLFALGTPFIFYAAQLKPYASDIAVALLVLLGVIDFRQRGADWGRAWRLGVLGALVVWVSHTAVLVLAGLGASLALLTWGAPDRRGAARPLALVLLLWTTSAGSAALIASHGMTPAAEAYLEQFWAGGFMPIPPRTFRDVVWPVAALSNVFAGGGFRYPLPGVFFAFAVLGAWALSRRASDMALLLIAPVAVTLVASAVHVYPFAGRVVLFLFPMFLILAAAGVEHLRTLPVPHGAGLGGLGVALCAGLAVVALARDFPPYRPEDLKPVLAAVQQARRPGDRVYVYYGGEKAFRYYGPRYGIRPGEYVIGGCWRENPRAYLRELDGFRGAPRVWVIVTHALPWLGEDALILDYLDRIGRRQATLQGPLREQGTGAAAAYLYDLSDPARLSQASGETYALPPGSGTDARGAWSC